MKGNLIPWWRTRSLREQRLLLVMAGLAVVVLAWLLVVRPLGDALSAAKERHGAAVIALAQVRADAAAVEAAESSAVPAVGGTLDQIISQTAGEAGFTITRLEPQGSDQATLMMAAVRPQAFFGWVARMESAGLIVEQLSATPNSDQTLSVQVGFRRRGN